MGLDGEEAARGERVSHARCRGAAAGNRLQPRNADGDEATAERSSAGEREWLRARLRWADAGATALCARGALPERRRDAAEGVSVRALVCCAHFSERERARWAVHEYNCFYLRPHACCLRPPTVIARESVSSILRCRSCEPRTRAERADIAGSVESTARCAAAASSMPMSREIADRGAPTRSSVARTTRGFNTTTYSTSVLAAPRAASIERSVV